MKQYSLKLRKILLCNYLYYVLLILCIIYVYSYIKNYIPLNNYNINDTKFNLTIKEYKIDGNKLSISFNENLIGSYYFNTEDEKNDFNLKIGDKVFINGTLSIPSNNTIFNTFNYKEYLYHKRINYILNMESIEYKYSSKNIFIKIKNYIYQRISNYKDNEYLYAFILGKSSYIDNEVYNNYKINGVTHLFALSGLHVSMFSSFILFILNKLKINEKLSFIITSIFLIFFSFIASFTPSILRATIFFILSSINKIWYFYIKPKYLLFITFIILELIDPFYIFNTGFILSFTITFSILLVNEKYKVENKILSILFISIISFLSSIPIIINMNYELNIIGFINNIFFIPFVTYIVFPLSLLDLLFPFLNDILIFFINIMESISKVSSNILNLTIYFSHMNYIEIIIYYVLFLLILKRKNKIIILFVVFMFYLYIKPNFDKNSYVYFIDVGQGDSILIRTKNNKSILIDTGGKVSYSYSKWKTKNKEFNLMKDTMIPFFKSIGIKKIDYLFITHGDADHCGYSSDLVNNFNVENIFINVGEVNYCESKLDYKIVSTYYEIDNVKIYSLNDKDFNNENKSSMILYVLIDNYKFLFTGDADIESEEYILKKYNLNNIDFLKVGHHGSNTSTSKELIDQIHNKYSIISVGKNNKYGHPYQITLDKLSNSKIYRTDIDGSIEIKIKSDGYSIETCSP